MSWIVIPNWDRFQHYGLARRPVWVKNYVELLHKDEYIDLPPAARGLLHGIWLAYADRDGRLRQDDVSATLHARVGDAQITSLNQAGFIDFSASRPLPLHLKKEEQPVDNSSTPTDLKIVAASKRDRLHEQLLEDARAIAKKWNGGGSDVFADQLEEAREEAPIPALVLGARTTMGQRTRESREVDVNGRELRQRRRRLLKATAWTSSLVNQRDHVRMVERQLDKGKR